MSSSEHSHDEGETPPAASTSAARQAKRRRVQTTRACDRCRLKKIRCDGIPGATCSHCAATESPCIFTPRAKPARYIDKKYVDKLETRMHRLERLLARLHPNDDFTNELAEDEPSPITEGNTLDSTNMPVSPLDPPHEHSPEPLGPSAVFMGNRSRFADEGGGQILSQDPGAVSDDDDGSVRWPVELSRPFRNDLTAPRYRYYGRSSSARFVQTALNVHSGITGTDEDVMQRVISNARLRPDFWKPHPWERARAQSAPLASQLIFPEADLLEQLIENYFSFVYPLFAALHRPTFLADYGAGKHLHDDGFAAVVLLVCALAARTTDDPRVYLDYPGKSAHPHSAGWAWFRQVQLVRNTALVEPCVYDLQIIILSVQYMVGISPTQACWAMAGIGIRMALDAGAHRKRMYQGQTVRSELWKRAFWALVSLDVWFSAMLGRPCAISLNSIDVDLPPDCDDEYWLEEDPAKAFKQPPGKPSANAHFVCFVRLHLIYSHALRTIYAPKPRKEGADLSSEGYSVRMVSGLDSALNAWYNSIPAHLRWDPSIENDVFFMQSSALHSAFRLVQMTIHRPFIASPTKSSPLCLTSLAICTAAARACIHVQQQQLHRRRPGTHSASLLPCFMAAVILLIRLWLQRRAKMRIDADKEMEDVHLAVQHLADGESKWPLAGRLKDILLAISTASDLPLPTTIPLQKRRHSDSGDENEEYATFQPWREAQQQRDGLYEFPRATSGMAMQSPHPLVPASADLPSEEISTFGPPLSPQSNGLFLFDLDRAKAAMGLNSEPSAFAPARLLDGQSYQPTGDLASQIQPPQGLSGMPFNGLPLGYADLHRHFSGLCATPSPSLEIYSTLPQDHSSPQTYPSYQNQLFDQPPFTATQLSPVAQQGVRDDEFINFLTPIIPHDPDVVNDAAAVWSTMPPTFRTDEWNSFLSGFMDITGSGPTNSGEMSGRQQQQQQQQGAPSLF